MGKCPLEVVVSHEGGGSGRTNLVEYKREWPLGHVGVGRDANCISGDLSSHSNICDPPPSYQPIESCGVVTAAALCVQPGVLAR